MMAKLGFKVGDSLGKHPPAKPIASDSKISPQPVKAHAEPLNLIFKEDRGGIGLDSEKKRKIREEAEESMKRIKREEGDYRDRVREERELRRTEAQVRAAQKVAERLDSEYFDEISGQDGQLPDLKQMASDVMDNDENEIPKSNAKLGQPPTHVRPTSQINVLYRGLVREREERDRCIQARHALQSSLPSSFFPDSKLPGYDDTDLEREDKQALGTRPEPATAVVEQELEEEDPELDAFNALEPAERLQKLLLYLRNTYRYCFWCKYRYETDVELEGCPGLTEEDHD